MRLYKVVPTTSLKAGDLVCNYFETEPAAIRCIEVDAPRAFIGAPFAATLEDLADARRYPFAVVPVPKSKE